MPEQLCRSRIGVVAIGRNEGARLGQCLSSVAQLAGTVVYVDSGSSDGSVELARNHGAAVVALNLDTPFTAGRARNAGFDHLLQLAPELLYVQFVDADCQIVPEWLDRAARFLDEHPGVAAVCGRRRERHPQQSVYNGLCDIEWNTPVGETKACGGDAMMRVDAFKSVRGFSPDLIAGEEPELCVRLRTAGWRIWRMADEMTLHDAAMLRFGQWWRRTLRCGHAFAQGAELHGAAPELHWVRESRRAWLWGLGLPLLALAVAAAWSAWGLLLFGIYPLQVMRLALREKPPAPGRWQRAGFLVLGKFPEMLGQLKFLAHRFTSSRPRLIEYK
ncbi:MAG: glycosyltransferase [Burkholderiales bacterium]|nr:glycosyltransferase [Burkholderiales bacterium]MDP2398600.1 glycosyltransferase [Burkholderiales bacterium]MDP3715930.1 glycosyltransferase [Burkholderiales bacterium]